MKKLCDRLGIETVLGGIFGSITLVAIIVEIALADFETAAVVGGIKDFFGTLITVVMLVVAVRALIPKKKINIGEKIMSALDEWVSNNSNMLVHNERMNGSENKYGIGMKTDMRSFYSMESTGINAGWFVRLPAPIDNVYSQTGLVLDFHLNKGTFFEGIDLSTEDLKIRFNFLADKFSSFINQKCSGFATAIGKNDTIKVTLKQPIETDEDIEKLMRLLDSMFQAYLVAANIKL